MAEDVTQIVKIDVQADEAISVLKEIRDALNDTSKQAGNVKQETDKINKTNLGNVRNQINGLTDSFKAGEVGVKGLAKGVIGVGKALITTFITNPILLAVTAIVGAVAALVAVFAKFEPIIDKIEQGFAALSAIGGVLKAGIFSLFTGTDKLGKSFKEAAKEAIELKKREQELADTGKILEVQNQATANAIDELVLKSKNRTLTEKERLDYIQQAMDLEKKQFDENKKRANEAREIALLKLKEGKTISDEELKDLRTKSDEEQAIIIESWINKKYVDRKKYEDWVKTVLDNQKLDNESIKFREKIQNREDQLYQQQLDNIQKVKDAEEKAKEKTEKLKDDTLKLEKDWNDKVKKDDEDFNDWIDGLLEDQLKSYEEEGNKEVQSTLNVSDSKQKIREQEAKDAIELEKQRIEETNKESLKAIKLEEDIKNASFQLTQDTIRATMEFDNALTQTQINNANKLLKNKTITQEQYDKKVAEIQLKAAKREKAFAIASTIIDTAGAIVKMLKDPGGVPGAIMSAAAGILGAAQIATILSTPIDGSSTGTAPSSPNISTTGEGTAPNTSFSFSPSVKTPEQPVIKTYVISKDVDTQQQLDRAIIANGSI